MESHLPTTRTNLGLQATCGCGKYTFRRIVTGLGLTAAEQYCERCRELYLVLTRGPQYLGAVRIESRQLLHVRSALHAFQLITLTEADALVHHAWSLARAAAARLERSDADRRSA